MSAIEHIEKARNSSLVDEDGEPVAVELLPPLPAGRIDELERQVGLALPGELRTLLAYCSGIDGCLGGIDFTGASMSFEHLEIFPHGLPIAADGCGNFWVLDLTPDTAESAPVFYACHDAPVILLQSADLATFLREVFRLYVPPHASLVNEVHDDRPFDVWRKNPGLLAQPEALRSSDPVVREFAASLTESFQIADLRTAAPGMGFSWGRYGANTEVRRCGFERIFAYAKPARTGLLAKMFSRK